MDTQHVRYIIGDNETCGLGEAKRTCQVGLIEIDPITLEPLWECVSLIDPQYPIGEKATEIHGITDDMVAQEPTMAEFVEHRLPLHSKGASGPNGQLTGSITLVAHNLRFDYELLVPIGGIDRGICTLNEARHWIRGPANFKLATLAEYFGIKAERAHDALADCHTTRLLLRKIVQASGQTLHQLATAKEREVHVMPWGRHMGVPLIDVPRPYLRWMLEECKDLEPNLLKSVQKVLAL